MKEAGLSYNLLVSIVVVNYNCKDYFKSWLESIAKITYTNYEIIVIDNASSDGSFVIV